MPQSSIIIFPLERQEHLIRLHQSLENKKVNGIKKEMHNFSHFLLKACCCYSEWPQSENSYKCYNISLFNKMQKIISILFPLVLLIGELCTALSIPICHDDNGLKKKMLKD